MYDLLTQRYRIHSLYERGGDILGCYCSVKSDLFDFEVVLRIIVIID